MHSVNRLFDGCLWHITVNVEGLNNRCCLDSPSASIFLSLSSSNQVTDSSPSPQKYLPSVLPQIFSFTATSPSNFSVKCKPHAFYSSFSVSCVVIVCISCFFALRDTESYLAESHCSYQGHTAPIIKRAELPLCKPQIRLRKAGARPWLMLTLS